MATEWSKSGPQIGLPPAGVGSGRAGSGPLCGPVVGLWVVQKWATNRTNYWPGWMAAGPGAWLLGGPQMGLSFGPEDGTGSRGGPLGGSKVGHK